MIWITDGPPGGANQADPRNRAIFRREQYRHYRPHRCDQLSAQLGTIVVEKPNRQAKEDRIFEIDDVTKVPALVRRPTLTGYFSVHTQGAGETLA